MGRPQRYIPENRDGVLVEVTQGALQVLATRHVGDPIVCPLIWEWPHAIRPGTAVAFCFADRLFGKTVAPAFFFHRQRDLSRASSIP